MDFFNYILIKLRSPSYILKGECLKCGTCCKKLYSLDTYTVTDFKITTFLFPKYKRFEVIGKDSEDNLIFRCKLLNSDNTCSDYKNRPKMCKNFPNTQYGSLGQVPEGCGFELVPKTSFKNILEKSKKKHRN